AGVLLLRISSPQVDGLGGAGSGGRHRRRARRGTGPASVGRPVGHAGRAPRPAVRPLHRPLGPCHRDGPGPAGPTLGTGLGPLPARPRATPRGRPGHGWPRECTGRPGAGSARDRGLLPRSSRRPAGHTGRGRGAAGGLRVGAGGGTERLMRLHRLTLQAIGPFAERHEVDLDELSVSGLFLLDGPTGSGKSTLIDAVVFALYGTLAGGVSEDRLHSDHAAPGVEP